MDNKKTELSFIKEAKINRMKSHLQDIKNEYENFDFVFAEINNQPCFMVRFEYSNKDLLTFCDAVSDVVKFPANDESMNLSNIFLRLGISGVFERFLFIDDVYPSDVFFAIKFQIVEKEIKNLLNR